MSEENQPLIGSTMAFETRYEVRIQVLSSTPAPSPPAMCGRETLAMLVSSTSMNVASVTVSAINHGLMSGGTYTCLAGSVAAASLIAARPWAPPTFLSAAGDLDSARDRARFSPEYAGLL